MDENTRLMYIIEKLDNQLGILASNMKAVEHELEVVWEAINELQGIDPAKAGEPNE